MATDIFADTSGLYALLIPGDEAHVKACEYVRQCAQKGRRFVVTDYILDETVTLLRARGYRAAVFDLLNGIISSKACRIEWMNEERFGRVRAFFEKHAEKEWSFTDCFSFVTMKEWHLRDALSKDRHFRAAGFNPLLV